jgi:glycerol-3-phosphate acyltransferase PlsY
MNFIFLCWIIVAYFVGSIPTGYWLGKYWKGIDIRQHGSGNVGATNVLRVLGKGPGVFTLLMDVLKGAIPVIFVNSQGASLTQSALVGVAAIVGHTTSPFVGFLGGKGVATSAGVFLALLPVPAGISLLVFAICLIFTRMVSASSMAAAVTLSITSFLYSPVRLLSYVATAVAILVIWKHRSNIQRILSGTEAKIGQDAP